MPTIIHAAQECDATDDDSSTEAGNPPLHLKNKCFGGQA